MTDRRILPAVVVAAACAVGFLWLTKIPLGIVGPPYEWAWERIAIAREDVTDALLGAVLAIAVGILYLVTVAVGERRIEAASRWGRSLWLLALTVAGFFWLLAVQESPPYGLYKAPLATYYHGPSGYYFEARYRMNDVKSFLANYENRISDPADEDRVLHIGTHPPGLFLFERGLIWLCEQSDGLSRSVIRLQPVSVSGALGTIHNASVGTPQPLLRVDRAAVWLSVLLTQLMGVATVIPLYALLRRCVTRTNAWRAVAFWPLVPALAIFLPASDVLLPFFGMSFLALWMTGRHTRSLLLCLLSGVVLFMGMLISLAILPYALLAAAVTTWEVFACNAENERNSLTSELISVTCSLVGFFVPVAAMGIAFKLNLPRVWLTNLHNHADFYTDYPRTYWKWLIANPIELAFAVGAPLAVVALVAAVGTLRIGRQGNLRAFGMTVGCAAVWALLWLSGKNMGEAARLWIVIQPWAIIIAALGLGSGSTIRRPAETGDQSLSRVGWLIILDLQMLACLATVMRVTGFNFTGG